MDNDVPTQPGVVSASSLAQEDSHAAMVDAVEAFDEDHEVDRLTRQCCEDVAYERRELEHEPAREDATESLIARLGVDFKLLIANYRRKILAAVGDPQDW